MQYSVNCWRLQMTNGMAQFPWLFPWFGKHQGAILLISNSVLRVRCPSCHPADSVKALKGMALMTGLASAFLQPLDF